MTLPNDDELHAYVDGRLDAARRDELAAWLRAYPETAAKVAAWKRDADALRAIWTGDGAQPANAALDPPRVRRALQRRRRARLGMAAACVLALVLGLGAGWKLREARFAGEHPPMADAVAAYRLFAAEATPAAFNLHDRDALQVWLRAHFGAAGDVPDLQAQGYRLSGGHVLSTPEGAAAMLVYQADDGARIGLYLRPRTARLTQGERRDGRLLAQYWAEGDTAFAVVAPATQTQALRIAPLLRGSG